MKGRTPNSPRPFWEWGWRESTTYGRLYYIYRLAVRPLLAVAAVVGAVLVVVDAYPRATNTIFWREHEYSLLAQIHAGYDIAHARELLGVPTQVKSLEPTEYREWLYVRRDHFVQIVSDDSGRIILYSTTSCHPAFQPSFEIAGGELIATLQDQPLAETPARPDGGEDRWLFSESHRQMGYQRGETGSTPQMYWESTGFSGTASNNRVWFVGVNPLCVSEEQYEDLAAVSYFGDAPSAPREAQVFRRRFSANTYAEVVDLTPAISDLGQILLPPPGRYESECLDPLDDATSPQCGSVTVGTFWYDLGVFSNGTTRVRP